MANSVGWITKCLSFSLRNLLPHFFVITTNDSQLFTQFYFNHKKIWLEFNVKLTVQENSNKLLVFIIFSNYSYACICTIIKFKNKPTSHKWYFFSDSLDLYSFFVFDLILSCQFNFILFQFIFLLRSNFAAPSECLNGRCNS